MKLENLQNGKYKVIAVTAAMLIFVLFGAIQSFAQPHANKDSSVAEGDKENQVSENATIIELGIVNDQAVYLSKPVYPKEARAENVKGDVNVEVLINKKGIVIEAKAVSGNALLRKSAEWAARRSKFRPSKMNGEVIHIKGIIIYTFQ